MKRNAFTLLEILVVLAAVVLLTALMFPILARARESSKDSKAESCRTNLKQLALACKQYIQDYDELYPIAKNNKKGLSDEGNWAGPLAPYMKSTKIFQCPSDRNAKKPNRSSYGYNLRLSNKNESTLDDSSVIVLFFEVKASMLNWTQTTAGPAGVSGNKRHQNGSNFAFVDGHVKWYKAGAVGNQSTSRNLPTFRLSR